MGTKHDGHVDGNLNCIALYVFFLTCIKLSIAERHYFLCRRHGWSRSFTITPEEIPTLDYAALEDILEINTIKLRAVGVRIFIEHPPDSNRWAKVRPWKRDTSFVPLLFSDFFERRRRDGIVLRIDVRDGHERPVTDAGMSFTSAVGSFIAGSMRSEREREQIDRAWWRLGRDRLLGASTSTNATRRGGAAEETEDESGPPPTPSPRLKKVCVVRGSLAVAFPPCPLSQPFVCLPTLPLSYPPLLTDTPNTDYISYDRSWRILRAALVLLLPRPISKAATTKSSRTRATAVHLRLVPSPVLYPYIHQPGLAPCARG